MGPCVYVCVCVCLCVCVVQALLRRRIKAAEDEKEKRSRSVAKVLTGESVRKRKEAALVKARQEQAELRKIQRAAVPEGYVRITMRSDGATMKLGQGASLYFTPSGR